MTYPARPPPKWGKTRTRNQDATWSGLMEGDGQAGEVSDSHTLDVQELREKLQIAQEELELV